MRNSVRSGLAFVALFCALCSGTTPALSQARCVPAPFARVVKAVGIVSIPGPQLLQVAAGSEFDVCAGESVATGPRSQAAIQLLASNQTISINQNTTIRFVPEMTQAPRTVIELLEGIIRLFNPIGRQLDVRTPYATAGTAGTEFFVAYDPQTEETRAGVIEGLVRVTRNGDTLLLEPGQAAIAPRVGPLQRLDIVPADSVRWSIFYPPASWTLLPAEEVALAEPVARAWQAWRSGNLAAFATELNSVPQILPPSAPVPPGFDARSLLRFAALLLIVGQVEEAEAAIAQAELLYQRAALTPLVRPIAAIVGLGNCRSLGPGWALIPALRSVIAVARNRTEDALAQSECAVTAAREAGDPSLIAAAAIARSYALQSAFRLPEARAILAAVEPADDPLVLARLAELDLSLGNNRAARLEAQRANQLAPSLSLTSSILGFAALANYDFAAARTAFARAAAQSPGDPLPHLGLGLVAIRSGRLFSFGTGNLEEGRQELVTAVTLHPEYALARSYLGRTYAELRLYQDAFREWALAESADPNDPTAPLYRAFAERALNRPIEALRDIERSIALNDNRAVYRSRLLLDQDLATRTTDLASVYRDLGFDQLALSQAYGSLTDEPSNPGVHRFLSDTYLTMPRHEIASDSELLQSLLLQPINVQPLRPRLAREGLGVIDLQGPFRIGYNEFNPIFASNGLSLLGDAFGGNRGTYGENLVLSGIYNNASFSAGQFYYRTNGIRENNDLRHSIENAMVQVAVSDRASILAEFRHSAINSGDLRLFFDPDLYVPDRREDNDVSHYRLGGRFDFQPGLTGVAVWTRDHLAGLRSYSDGNAVQSLDSGDFVETALYRSREQFNLVIGGGYFSGHQTIKIFEPGFELDPLVSDADVSHLNAWLYTYTNLADRVELTLGASFDGYRSDVGNRDRISPKVGIVWRLASNFSMRAAFFQTLKRKLVGGQTIEPTEIAGFNQLFDDLNWATTRRWGVGADYTFSSDLFAGAEWSERFIKDTNLVGGIFVEGPAPEHYERLFRGYIGWTATDRLSVSLGLHHERLSNSEFNVQYFNTLTLLRVPLEARYAAPSGFFTLVRATYVHENGNFIDPFIGESRDDGDSFAVVDAGIGWRLPGRGVIGTLQVTNLLDTRFRYQDSDPEHPSILPRRMLLGRLTFSF